jgi:hypothetical protein
VTLYRSNQDENGMGKYRLHGRDGDRAHFVGLRQERYKRSGRDRHDARLSKTRERFDLAHVAGASRGQATITGQQDRGSA